MSDSILDSVKKVLNVPSTDESFDADVLMHINSILSIVCQLGVGPENGLTITDSTTTWVTFLGNDPKFNFVKDYVYLRVRMLFDPPTSSYVIDALTKQYQELEWRISALRESTAWVDPTVPTTT